MKTIIYVTDNHVKAIKKFNEFVKNCQSNKIIAKFSYSRLTVELPSVIYRFMSLSGNEDTIRGMYINKIVFDESANIDRNIKALLKTRLRS
jgi:hypothetical protein